MASSAFDKAREIDDTPKENSLEVKVVLYIGVFFDGTNNNKAQAMIGQFFRRKNLFIKHKKALMRCGVSSLSEMLKHDRSLWENGDGKDVFNTAELDKIYGLGKNNSAVIDDDSAVYGAESSVGFDEKNTTKYKTFSKLKKMSDISDSDTSWFQDKTFFSFAEGSTYTNPAILSSLYKRSEEECDGCKIIREPLYIEGSGTDTGVFALDHDYKGDVFGLGFGVGGTGVTEKCRVMTRRVKTLVERYSLSSPNDGISLHFQIFGFSRGATTARMFTYILNPQGTIDSQLKHDFKLFTGSSKEYLPLRNSDGTSRIEEKKIDFLGLYDTVASIGIKDDPINSRVSDALKLHDKYEEFSKYGKSIYHEDNVVDFGLNSTLQAEKVMHICALDENRSNFAIVDIQNSIGNNGTELFLPGCHTDIGGGVSFGVDDLKIINKKKIDNQEELLGQAEDVQGVAKGVAKTIMSAAGVVGNVSKVMWNIAKVQTGGGIFKGMYSVIKNTVATYESVKETIHNANKTVHKLKDTLCETQDEVSQELKEAEEFYSGSNGEGHGSLDKMISWGSETLDKITGVSEKMETVGRDGGKAIQSIAKVVTDVKNGDIFSIPNDVIESYSKTKETFTSMYKLSSEIIDSVDSIKSSSQDILDSVKHRIPDLNLMKLISDQIAEMIGDFRATVNEASDTVVCICDIIKQPKKRLFDIERSTVYMYDEVPAKRNDSESVLLEVGENALKSMGWVPYNIQSQEGSTFIGRVSEEELESSSDTILLKNTKTLGINMDNVGLYKYTSPGYSNVTLKLMYSKAEEEGNVIFEPYPDCNYGIPDDLVSFYDSIKSSIKGNQRYICSPEYHDAYRALRCKYLHFSTNQQLLSIADNRLVNPPSISTALKTSRSVIMRQVYSGDGSGGQKYLYDYDGESNTEMITVKCDVQTGEKFCVTPKIKMNERRS